MAGAQGLRAGRVLSGSPVVGEGTFRISGKPRQFRRRACAGRGHTPEMAQIPRLFCALGRGAAPHGGGAADVIPQQHGARPLPRRRRAGADERLYLPVHVRHRLFATLCLLGTGAFPAERAAAFAVGQCCAARLLPRGARGLVAHRRRGHAGQRVIAMFAQLLLAVCNRVYYRRRAELFVH